jgi:uncharacterized membrane protein
LIDELNQSMPNIHPMLLHFPLALLSVSVLCDFVGVVAKNGELHRVGWWTLLLGSFGLLATILSGLLAEKAVTIVGPAKETFTTHEQFAFVSASVFATLLLWRIGAKRHLPAKKEILYLAVGIGGVVMLFWGAWHGGELVYRFGVGVSKF